MYPLLRPGPGPGTGSARTLAVLALAAALLSPGAAVAARPAEAAADPLAVVQAAYAAAMRVRSGSGTGCYESYAREKSEAGMRLRAKAKVLVHFDAGKYYLRLDYERDGGRGVQRAVIVHDGATLFCGEFAPGIRPGDARLSIWDSATERAQPNAGGFPLNPSRLPAEVLWLDVAVRKYGRSFRVTREPDRSIAGSFDSDGALFRFRAPRECGHHVAETRGYLRGGELPYVHARAEWKRAGGLWFVQSLDRQYDMLDGSSTRTVFRYSSFEPNAKVAPDWFTLKALKLPAGAVTYDRRPNAPVPVR